MNDRRALLPERSGHRAPLLFVLFATLLLGAGSAPIHAQRAAQPQSHSPSPASVTIVGSLQNEVGCASDWDPACAATMLTYDAIDGVWQATFPIPAGNYEYKVALNGNWTESHPGANVALTLAATTNVKFYYSHATHSVADSRNAPVATAVGSFQSELGCAGDWQPDCLRSWLQDPDGDGTYTFVTATIPTGNYEAKVAVDESWAVNYGQNGAPGGANIPFNVPFDGAEMLFSYDGGTHVLTISSRRGDHDGNISWSDLLHDSRSSTYRTPGGAVTAGTAVKLRLRALTGDLTGAQVRLWNDRTNIESSVEMTVAASDALYDWWEATVTPGSDPTILWYRFIARDGAASAYHEDDTARDGGLGVTRATTADISWQITAYDPAFETPDWAKNGIVYQIFPDRFRNGNAANDTPPGSFFYDEAAGTIVRSGQSMWNVSVCDPRNGGGPCPGKYGSNFYGGDLQGVIDKLPYLDELGVTVLYLNPIFESPSNHKYDTSDYGSIDDNFGDLTTFQTLTSQAHAYGMKVVLDGVFNHTSSDSRYFDRYQRYGSPAGACEDTTSSFRPWYFFNAAAPGMGVCAGNTLYESWFGYDSLPKLNSAISATRQLIWNDTNSVSRYWLAQGADGWRLDVPGDIDPGLSNAPSNIYWEGFRTAVRAQKSDAWIVGEEWGTATPWLLGGEWDAAMNYQFSSAVLSFWRDENFDDNDHNGDSSAGLLTPLTPSQLDVRLRNLEERYPRESLLAMMNVLGTHDTNRALFMLDHRADENDPSLYLNPSYDWSDAIVRLKGAALLQMTLPGAPAIYYGDEVGLVGPVARSTSTWEDDPYNRQPFPWLDESGTPFYTHLQSGGAGEGLRAYYQLLTAARNAHAALRTGTFDTLRVDDGNRIYSYGRRLDDATDAAVVMINRSSSPQTIAVTVAGYVPEGAVFHDVLNANAPYTVTGGLLTVTAVPARSGALLVAASPLTAPPSRVTNLSAAVAGPTSVNLTWSAASGASHYDVYRSLLSGGGYTLAGSVSTPASTVTGLTMGTRYYFVVVSRHAISGLTSAHSNEVSAVPVFDMGSAWYNLQWPPTITHTISATTPTESIYGQIFISGGTEPAGATPGIRAQVGYAPAGSPLGAAWQWFEMAFSSQQGSNDEFTGSLLPDQPGNYSYAVRYSADNGIQWWYGDLSGPQTDGVLDNPGSLTVNASADTTAPAAPQSLLVSSTGPGQISLSWPANAEGDLAGYEIFRQAVAAPGYARIASVAAGATSYTDFSVTSGASYQYYIKAYDTSFNRSGASNVVTASAALRFVDVTFQVTVPSFTPATATLYITGNISELGSWNPAARAMTKVDATHWTYTLNVLDGTTFEYKLTRGSWETLERTADGAVDVNRQWTASYGATGIEEIEVIVANWRDPIVSSHVPPAAATNVSPSTTVAVTWSQQMPSNNDFAVSSPGGGVAGTFTYASGTRTTTFTPAAPLLQGTTYSVSVSGKVSALGNVQQVPVSWSFVTACNVVAPTVTAGGAVTFCEGGSVTLQSSTGSGNQWYRNGSPIPGATAASYQAGVSGSYTVRTSVDACSSTDSNAVAVTVNAVPATPTISVGGPTTFCAGGSVTLTSSHAAGNQWYRNGVALDGETGQVFVASSSGSYTVMTTSSGCASATSAATAVTVNPKPVFALTAPATLFSGASSSASVDAACSGMTFSWSITGGTITAGQGTPRITFTAGAAGALTLMVSVTNAYGCADTKTADVAVQLAAFGAPPFFRANASGNSAQLQWAAVQDAAQYEIYRSTDNVNWTLRGTSSALTHTDTGLTAATAYFYRVRALSADERVSSHSATDIAATVAFSDDPIPACPTIIKAAHVIELRQAINAARAGLGLGAATFDPSLAVGATIKAVHLTELRSALDAVLAAIAVTPAYTDPVITPGVTTAKAAHFNELRERLR